jgi:hypothetical protein
MWYRLTYRDYTSIDIETKKQAYLLLKDAKGVSLKNLLRERRIYTNRWGTRNITMGKDWSIREITPEDMEPMRFISPHRLDKRG